MVHVRFGILGAVLALALMASTCVLAAPYVQTYAVTTSALAADNPTIWGNYVVWQATGTGSTDIFAATITSGDVLGGQIMTVCSANGVQSNPTVGAGFVAWEDRRNDALSDLFAASANWSAGTFSTFQVSGRTGSELNPAIWNNTLVYNYNNGSYTIQSYNLSTRTGSIVEASSSQKGAAAINADYVVWHDARAGTNNYEIWGFDRADYDDFLAVGRSGSQLYPVLNGSLVAWNETNSGYYRIGFKNLATGTTKFIANGAFDMKFPSISGDYIVWQDKRSGNWDIYGYQISTGEVFTIAGGAGDQDKPQIFGDRIVYRELIGTSSQIRYAVFGAAPAVPEPASLLALITGLLGSVGFIPRRRSG